MNLKKKVFLHLTYKGDIHAGDNTELVFEEEWVECGQRGSERVR